ncbi:MAG: alanine--tRNA ligase [Gammaproteobacteria bacterium]
MKTAEIRRAFIDFFIEQGHTEVESSSLVPANDPSLLFTNAGMVQFKDVFLGLENRGFDRATSSQRCVRAGGKHNDLDNVGYTARHHTFFEMLGNFSFGEYFKKEAIGFAWTLLTERLGIPAERLWITVFEDDDEAASIWLDDIGVSPERFSRCGEKDNFWMMGDTGPCGPCSEIFYDHGDDIPGGPPGTPEEDGDRYVEIWNLVFMQYDRSTSGELKPIPKPSVDTGMGLERIAAVLQGVHNNYDIDLFVNLVSAVTGFVTNEPDDPASLRVIADHIRSCAFLVLDGVLPSNEGRGYVLRRIIRRALRHGHKLGIEGNFFHRLVAPLAQEMGEAYPELLERSAEIAKTLEREEIRFAETLDQGMKILDVAIESLDGNSIPGETIFQLYDTYGFPFDLTADIARERNLILDEDGFHQQMEAQRQRARDASQFGNADVAETISADDLSAIGNAQSFTGYERLTDQATVVGLFCEGRRCPTINKDQTGVLILDTTPFYAESGGQVGDVGSILSGTARFEVSDTRSQGGLNLHYGKVIEGTITEGDSVNAEVASDSRHATRLNHSATHLMHAALREQLGAHIEQKGSLVQPERLRFDFSHPQPVSDEECRAIELRVNEQIRLNASVETNLMNYEAAVDSGALALFGEKYGDEVRVLRMGDFSTELCGGTHVDRTGDIGLFKIVSESGVAAGIRRIEAVTGVGALKQGMETEERLARIATTLKSNPNNLETKIQQVVEVNRALEKEIETLRGKLAGSSSSDVADNVIDIADFQLVSARIEGADAKSLRATMDRLRDKWDRCVVVLATEAKGKALIVTGVSKGLSEKIHAGELVNYVAQQVGGKGGGRPDMAQAGGNDIGNLDQALASVEQRVRDLVAT